MSNRLIVGLVLAVLTFASIACTERPGVDVRDSINTAYRTGDPALDRLQELIRLTLEANRKEFAGRIGTVRGFGAGTLYPQIWLRDSATLIPVIRYYYPVDYLRSWLEEHLAHQRQDGQLYDWVAPGPASYFRNVAPKVQEVYRSRSNVISADKNTTEADQETSAVMAAAWVFGVTGDRAWLQKPITGQSVLERLDRALEYLLHHRLDPETGLITNAFTADWGDVSPVYPDQRAIYLDEHTPQVAGLYTNALFYHAAMELASLCQALGRTKRAAYWREKAAAIREGINRYLWQEDRGFYRMHRVLPSARLPEEIEDGDIFALGGHALAILYGIADDHHVQRILNAMEARRRQLGISTIAVVLLPPYPSGFFRHPIMREAYTYQNGGQWDWWAGRFILAEFERGHARRAYRHLVEIARRVVRSGGLYEWYTRDDQGRGSPHYAGSAGALGRAIFEGLFGIYLGYQGLDLKIRLGKQTGRIGVYEPATDKYVEYRYRYDDSKKTIDIRYESNVTGMGTVSILLPEDHVVTALLLDGERVPFQIQTVGEDTYLTFRTDWKPHRVEVRLQESQRQRQ